MAKRQYSKSRIKSKVSNMVENTLEMIERKYINAFSHKHEIRFFDWDKNNHTERIALFELGDIQVPFQVIRHDIENNIKPPHCIEWAKGDRMFSYIKFLEISNYEK